MSHLHRIAWLILRSAHQCAHVTGAERAPSKASWCRPPSCAALHDYAPPLYTSRPGGRVVGPPSNQRARALLEPLLPLLCLSPSNAFPRPLLHHDSPLPHGPHLPPARPTWRDPRPPPGPTHTSAQSARSTADGARIGADTTIGEWDVIIAVLPQPQPAAQRVREGKRAIKCIAAIRRNSQSNRLGCHG